MENIEPDFGFPGATLLRQVASWILGGSFLIAFIALIVALVLIGMKGFGNQQLQNRAGSSVLWVFAAVVLLGGIGGIFHLLIGLDLGLGG